MTRKALKLVLDDHGSFLGMEKGCFVVKDKHGEVERYPLFEKEISEVDQYFGTHDLPHLLKALEADYKHELVGERLTTTPILEGDR